MGTVYLKYDPFNGTPIPDGFAEQYAVDVVNAANEDREYDSHFHISSDLVLDSVRALIAEKAADPRKIVFQLPDCPDQFATHHGRLNHWPRRDYNLDVLSRILKAER